MCYWQLIEAKEAAKQFPVGTASTSDGDCPARGVRGAELRCPASGGPTV